MLIISMVSSHVSLSPMMSKCSIFVSAISSSIFGGSDWILAESTLSVFGCRCGGGGGRGGDGGWEIAQETTTDEKAGDNHWLLNS